MKHILFYCILNFNFFWYFQESLFKSKIIRFFLTLSNIYIDIFKEFLFNIICWFHGCLYSLLDYEEVNLLWTNSPPHPENDCHKGTLQPLRSEELPRVVDISAEDSRKVTPNVWSPDAERILKDSMLRRHTPHINNVSLETTRV